MWTVFLLFAVLLGISFFHPLRWAFDGFILIDQLSLVMGAAVSLFSSIVISYAVRYLAGAEKLPRFVINCLLFAFSVMFMVMADHIILFILSWLGMGLLMAELIGGYTHYLEGKASKKTARNYFLLASSLLGTGFVLLALHTGSWSISEIVQTSVSPGQPEVEIAIFLLITAAVVQSALYPFQRWLMSSMTAPTPASALMHAGFVNAGAILLARVAPMLYMEHMLWILVLVGGIGALVGKFSKFVQANIKQKLACSTTAQMGFMLLECGLGFFAAAITHLILHGFYKAYLFLSSGDMVSQVSPHQDREQQWKPWQLPVTLISGLVGGLLFAYSTGKGLELNSGLFLTVVIVLTVIHGSQDLLKHASLSPIFRLIALPLVIIPALLVYAVFFDMITHLLAGVPMVEVPTALTWDQLVIGILYLVSFIVIELKLYKKFGRLYVYLLNISQPKSNTILQ